MATKQARLQLGMDIKPLQEATRQVKKQLEDLSNVRAKQGILKDLTGQIQTYKVSISNAQLELLKMTKVNGEAFDSKRVKDLTDNVTNLTKSLREAQRAASNVKLGLPNGAVGGGVGGAAQGFGGKSLLGGAGRMLGALGLGLGVQQSISRSIGQAKQGLGVRELTGGGLVDDKSRFGFTRDERRERAESISRTSGKDLTSEDLSRRTDQSEMLQRAFGISGEQFAGAIGGARKAGVDDEEKFVGNAVGDAVANGLSGSAVGEYLAQMTQYLEGMSTGIDVNQSSLRGMAGAIGSLDFFKKDPSRLFDALQGMEKSFKDNDPYQQFLSIRALNDASGGKLNPAGLELRRQMPLFGGVDDKEMQGLRGRGYGQLADVFGTSGEDSVNSRAQMVMQDTKGMDQQSALLAFSEAMGLKPGQALPIFTDLMDQMKTNGGDAKKLKIGGGALSKMKEATQSPEDRAAHNMNSFEGAVKHFDKRVDDLKNVVSDGITSGTLKLVGAIDKFSDATGLFHSDVEKIIAAIIGGVAGKAILGGLGGMGDGGGKAGSMGFLSKGGALVAAGFAGYEFGAAIREQLNSWTHGEWDNSVDSFWKKIANAFGVDIDGSKKDKQTELMLENGADWAKEAEKQGLGKLDQEKMGEVAELHEKITDRRHLAAKQKAYKAGETLTDEQLSEIPEPTAEDTIKLFKRNSEKGSLKKMFETADEEIPKEFVEGYYDEGGIVTDKAKAFMKSAFGMSGDKKKEPSKKDSKGSDWFGGPSLSDKVASGLKKQRGYASGGPVGSDTVPAWLTPGEFVVKQPSVGKNISALHYANAGGLIEPKASDSVGMPSIDFSSLTSALGSNTGALNALTAILQSVGSGGSAPMRDFPRGQAGMRYGHG